MAHKFAPQYIHPLQNQNKTHQANPSQILRITKPSKDFFIESRKVGVKRFSLWSLMAASVSLSAAFKGSWGSSMVDEDYGMLAKSVPRSRVGVGKPTRSQPMMKNVNEGKGLFAPIVVVTRDIVGKKRFNQLRGKAIAVHSQVITEFCKSIGADAKQKQGLIRLAKKNGERLGFLA